MANGKKRGRPNKTDTRNESESTAYEQFREQRIKENLERMEKMGILELSKKINNTHQINKSASKKVKISQIKAPALPSSQSPRRSSRLNTMARINYEERAPKEARKAARNTEINIEEGSEPEIYTMEHEKLLGDSKAPWVLYVDGFDDDGKRMYDPVEGKSCHQCRQKTLGKHTDCSICKIGLGQFCGDCLFMRYGENVMEVNENPSWTCPVCRGICNCSRCRQNKGWKPTGSVYKKVKHLGFKSVAHYLIQTRQSHIIQEKPITEIPHSENGMLPITDAESELTGKVSEPILIAPRVKS